MAEEYSEFWYDTEWCPVLRWVDYDPGRLVKFEAEHKIGDYYMFAKTAGGSPWCWHAGYPTEDDEFEVHKVDLFMYLPVAPTLAGFLFRQHLEGLVHCKTPDDLDRQNDSNSNIIAAIFPQAYVDQIDVITSRMRHEFQAGNGNSFAWEEYKSVLKRNFPERYLKP